MTEGERDTERNRHTNTGDRETEGGGGTSYVASFADVGLLLIKECKQCLKSIKQNRKLTNKNSSKENHSMLKPQLKRQAVIPV